MAKRPKTPKLSIHQIIAEDVSLACIYAEDGALHTAAAILARLAIKVKDHASATDFLDNRDATPWSFHIGEDYAVVMLGDDGDSASIRVRGDDMELPAKIASLLNALGNR